MDKDTIQKLLEQAGFADLLPHIDALTRTSILLVSQPVKDEKALPVGTSKIGGTPDLPTDFVWPTWQEQPQAFVAQINLQEAHPFDLDGQLPAQGILWFFYDASQETSGNMPEDAGAWHVVYRQDTTGLQQATFPDKLPAASRFQPCSVTFQNSLTISAQPQLESSDIAWDDEKQEKYDEVFAHIQETLKSPIPTNRLLGIPDTLQDDMRLLCELNVQGIEDMDDPRVEAAEENSHQWQLLLQIATDERIGMRWGSSGMLYYWIRQRDLRAQTFDDAWMVLQSE